MKNLWRLFAALIALVGVLAAPGVASAADVAVFGDNQIDNRLVTAGHTVTLVTDAQIATPGFLSNFDVFVYTRTGSSTGTTLSEAAAANVKAYVHRTVLLNGDFADAVGQDTEIEQLIVNSVNWAAATGHGYVGEFNGAFAGLTSNGNGLRPLDLIPGAAAAFNASNTDYGNIAATTFGASHPVLAGVALPRDPAGVEIGAAITGVDTHRVIARYTATNNPAIIVRDLDATKVAEFGDNQIDDELAGAGMDVTVVTDAQLATAGFLDNFDVFVYTRTGSSTGTTLSEAAANNVKAYVRRTVLLNGDFADAVGQDTEIEQLIVNSVNWAAATGHGYVGEFNGAFAGLTSNGNGLRPLDLIPGAAAAFNASNTDYGNIAATTFGADHPVLDGIALPRDPAGVEIGAAITGVDTHRVIARYTATNNPAIIVRDLDATQVAEFGDNQIDDMLAGNGMDVTIVTDAQLATAGFLNNFDVFVYTRTGSSTGIPLSEAAAANVKAYVHRTVLLNGDFADAVGQDTEIEELIVNSVTWAAATGHGYVGEFNGAFAGLTSNGNGLRPLDLIPGVAGPFTASNTDFGTINATTIGTTHPVLDGVALPRDPAGVEIGAAITGVDTHRVIARYTATNNPAIMVRDLDATQVAEFGDNQIDDLLAGAGMDVTIVTDAQLATAGFLNNFDVFVYTRNGSSTGTTLSEAAAANVKAFVQRTVLLNGDFADAVGQDTEIEQLIVNSVTWAAATGHGYVGEFNGAFAGLTSNGNGLRPLDLIAGAAGPFTASNTDFGTINATTIGTTHPVLDGVALPRDPAGVEIGAAITGVAESKILARYAATGNPAIIASGPNQAPTATDAAVSVAEDGSVSIVLAGTDPDGDPLTFTVTSPPAHGTFVGGVYTPAPNYNGPDSIGFTVSDGRGGSDTGTIAITVTPVNDPPVCSPSSFVVPADGQHTGTLVCTDVDDVTLSYEVVSGPAHGVLVLATNGSFTYTPNPGYFGPDVFTFRAVDVSGGSGSAQVSITVTAPPDPNAPTCVATATGRDAAGKPYVEYTLRDVAPGLASIEVLQSTNATTPVPAFAAGTTDPVVVRATRTDDLGSSIVLRATDVVGNTITCQLTFFGIGAPGAIPHDQHFLDLPRAQHFVSFQNGTPGLKRINVKVNGVVFKSGQLAPGERGTFDIASAMTATNNRIAIDMEGNKNATLVVIFHDGSASLLG
jgi:uncharacterized protein YvpB